jgi:hypothetical protein
MSGARLQRSAGVPLGANRSRRRGTRPYGQSARKPLPDFIERGAVERVAQLAEQIVRERHTFEGRARLELAMQVGGHISDLNHHGHVISVLACEVHVKRPLEALAKEYPAGVENKNPRNPAHL